MKKIYSGLLVIALLLTNCLSHNLQAQVWTSIGTGVDSTVWALTEYNSNLVAGGDFTHAGGDPANHIALWNGSSWSALGSGVNGTVNAFTVYNGNLIVGGNFTTAGGNPANCIAEWNGTSWSPMGLGMGNPVYALFVSYGTLYAGGIFFTAGGDTVNFIAQWNGSTWTSLGVGTGSTVLSLGGYGGQLIVGGNFIKAGGKTDGAIAQWNGSTWSKIGGSFSLYEGTCAIVNYGSKLIAAGGIDTAGGNPVNNIAQWNGSTWSKVGNGIGNLGLGMTTYSNSIVVGGQFNMANFNPANFIAGWDGSTWYTFGSGMNNYVMAVTLYNGYLVAGGKFTTAGGNPMAHITAWQPGTLTTSVQSHVDVKCNGSCTGSAVVSTISGTPPYTYSWSPSGGTGDTALGMCAGTYTCTVIDAASATATVSVVITQPAALIVTTKTHAPVCFGYSNGSDTAIVTGGVGGYMYLWTPTGITSSAASNLSAGCYTVTVTDKNGCTATALSCLSAGPTQLRDSISSFTNILCNGGNNGTATVGVKGGVLPYTYTWSNGETESEASGLTAGCYTITVKDSNGCTVTASACLTQPPKLIVTVCSITNVLCNGRNTGCENACVSGGTTPYFWYSWSNGETWSSACLLTAGTYTVAVTDAHGCTATASGTVTQPPALIASICSVTEISCNGKNNGCLDGCASGGTIAYTYSWSNGATSNTNCNLSAGTYTLTVTDGNGCSATASGTITQPPALTVTTKTGTIKCFGYNDGSDTAIVSGGTSPYTYSWAPSFITSSAVSGLSAGCYTVTVTDKNGCTATALSCLSAGSPQLRDSIISVSNILCNGGNTGTASVGVKGGTGKYTYSWSYGATSSSVTGLTAGCYTVTVTDSNGCSATATACLSQPSKLTATICSVTNIKCFGDATGCLSVCASGGTPIYSFSWSNGQTSSSTCLLIAGTYTCTVIDANGCTATASGTITQPPQLRDSIISVTEVTCNGGSNGIATDSVYGGTMPYTYLWDNGETGSKASGLTAGCYTVTVTDSNGCNAFSNVCLTQPTALTDSIGITSDTICPGGCATVFNLCGNAVLPVTYVWSNGTTTDSLTVCPVVTTTYTCVVRDSNGCTITATIKVVVCPLPPVSVKAANDTACVSSSKDSLIGTPPGGVFSGLGVSGNNFNPSIAGIGNHLVTYVYTTTCGCKDTVGINIVVVSCTGINELNPLDGQVKFYPDPFSQSVNIDISIDGPVTVSMFNMLGQNISSWILEKGHNVINTSSYPSGVYMLQVKTSNGLLNKKLIKVN